MAKHPKKQSFLGAAAILTGAVVLVKIIGFFYKIPLNNLLDGKGKAYFNVAYYIYNVLLTISTAGLPLAISKLTSEAQAAGRENQKRKLFRTSIWLFFVLGVAGTAFMFFKTDFVAEVMHNAGAAQAIRVLSPAVFCVCILSCMRGYTQGQGDMTPSAVSQVLEAICKLGIGLPLAWYLIKSTGDMQFGAAGAILGVPIGTALSMLFMAVYMMRRRSRTESLDVPDGGGTLLKKVLAIGIPITLGNSALSLINLLDTSLVLGRLQGALHMTEDAASMLYGQYSKAMDLVNLPPSFVYPLTMSLLPFAAAALTRKDAEGADRIISSAFRLIALLALPAGVGLSVLGRPICLMLYPAQPEDAVAAGPHLQMLGISCIFICIMILTNAILQTYGKERIPIFTVVAGGATKIFMNYVLVGDPEIGINGAPISTICCYLVIAGLNLFFVWKYSPKKPNYFALFFKPAVASALMGAAAWASYGFLDRALSAGHSAFAAAALSTVAAIGLAVAVYGVLVLALGILRAEDVRAIPHGEKLIRLLRLK